MYLRGFGGPVDLVGDLAFGSHSPRCLRIFFMTSSSSMNDMIFIVFEHFGHIRGSTFADQVRETGSYLLEKACPALSEFPGPDRSFLMDMYKVRLGIVRSPKSIRM